MNWQCKILSTTEIFLTQFIWVTGKANSMLQPWVLYLGGLMDYTEPLPPAALILRQRLLVSNY